MRETIEYYGVGQSGYTAGRNEHDPALALELQAGNALYPRLAEGQACEQDPQTDDRWTGRGGPLPSEPAPPAPPAPPAR
jgi:hypothetical protein